ncbi:MAG: hypothetical protein JHC98_04525 [Thermoleophilaceae bacterium]|nr:hypothetical protein [Thermoleophilaceae bacterium]
MKRFSKIALSAAGLAAIYHFALRERVLNWGTTDAEVAAVLPGDELLPEADGVSTRAITIDAPPSAVWPWIVQIGPKPRGGVYTYDWIENLLGLNMQSTRQVLEEFQHPTLGDEIGFGGNKMVLAELDPQRSLAWRSSDGNWVWSFTLIEDEGRTRFVSRNRFRLPRAIDKIGMVPMIPGSLVMERKMLLGIKERAESLSA